MISNPKLALCQGTLTSVFVFCFFVLAKNRNSSGFHLMNQCLQLLEPILQPCEQCLQHQNRRDGHISVNKAPRAKFQKTKVNYFSILRTIYFIHICPRSHIYRDTAVAVILMLETLFTGLEKWFKKLETLVHQVKTGTVPVFSQNKKTKNKNRGQCPLTQG